MSKFRCEVDDKDYLSVYIDSDYVEFKTYSERGYGVFLTSDEIRRLGKKLKKHLIAIEGNDPDRNGNSN